MKIRDLQGKVRFTGRTDADGVVEGPGASKLVKVKPRGETTASGDDEGGEGEWDEYRARRVLVTAQAADDLAVLDTNWNNGIQVWNFAVTEDRRGGSVRIRGFLHSDRGLYRPGDTVHLHGIARVVDVSGAMTLPRKRRIHVIINDPRGLMLLEKDVALTSFGGFSLDLPIAEEARLGDYAVKGQLEDQTFSDAFSVEEYRPRTFEVKVNTPHENTLLGKPLKFELAASYLYGSPLRAGKVVWNVRRTIARGAFPRFRRVRLSGFLDALRRRTLWARDSERSFSDAVADGELELDATGKTTIVTHDETLEHREPQDYLLKPRWRMRAVRPSPSGGPLLATKVSSYLGMHPSEFVQAVDMPFGVQVVGFDREGVRRAAQAELTLTRRSYDCGTHASEPYWSCKRNQAPNPRCAGPLGAGVRQRRRRTRRTQGAGRVRGPRVGARRPRARQ